MIDFVKNFLQDHPWILLAAIPHFVILGTVAYLILLERKVASWVQDRIGPNRVGPGGLFQPIADGVKFIMKEDYRPAGVDKAIFSLAPGIMIVVIIISIAVLPWGGIHQVNNRRIDVTKEVGPNVTAVQAADRHVPGMGTLVGTPVINDEAGRTVAYITYRYPFQAATLNIGVLYILAVLSLAVYGVVLGGWASNNKYSFLGGLRATAQMISYEIPLGLSVLCIVILFGTLDLGEIVEKQCHYWIGFIPAWNVFTQPVTFFMFLICIHAEANRAPFDLAEAEQELVGGYHTEYSAMRFALFFLAEYAGMITTSAVCVALFFGGWHFPGLSGHIDPNPAVTDSLLICLIRFAVFFGKTIFVIFIFMWVRWSLPRFRFDQLMMLAWRALIPISLALLVANAIVLYFFSGSRGQDLRVNGTMALALLLSNLAVVAIAMIVSRFLPPPPETNRRVRVEGSRFNRTPLSATAT